MHGVWTTRYTLFTIRPTTTSVLQSLFYQLQYILKHELVVTIIALFYLFILCCIISVLLGGPLPSIFTPNLRVTVFQSCYTRAPIQIAQQTAKERRWRFSPGWFGLNSAQTVLIT